MLLKQEMYALTHLQRKMMLIRSETVHNMNLWHYKLYYEDENIGNIINFFAPELNAQ